MVDEMTNQVVTKHRLPDGLKLIDEAFASTLAISL
jgi:hypothetical protein